METICNHSNKRDESGDDKWHASTRYLILLQTLKKYTNKGHHFADTL